MSLHHRQKKMLPDSWLKGVHIYLWSNPLLFFSVWDIIMLANRDINNVRHSSSFGFSFQFTILVILVI